MLLRFVEPPGLRRGIFDARAGRRSPNRKNWAVLVAEFLRPNGSRGPDACPRAARNTPLARRELPFLPGVRPALLRR